MDMRAFGRTGMRLSVLGFGCGAVASRDLAFIRTRGDEPNWSTA